MSPDSCIFPLVRHVKPRFEINCIFSFIGAEQQIGDSLLTIEDDNLCLIQCDEILHRNLQTLPDLMCAILESSNEKHVFPKDLYKISTCLMENSIYQWDGVLERIPVFQALMRRDGKFFFNRERDDIEQAIALILQVGGGDRGGRAAKEIWRDVEVDVLAQLVEAARLFDRDRTTCLRPITGPIYASAGEDANSKLAQRSFYSIPTSGVPDSRDEFIRGLYGDSISRPFETSVQLAGTGGSGVVNH
eukprot:3601006-Prymnesium_polylepis.1